LHKIYRHQSPRSGEWRGKNGNKKACVMLQNSVFWPNLIAMLNIQKNYIRLQIQIVTFNPIIILIYIMFNQSNSSPGTPGSPFYALDPMRLHVVIFRTSSLPMDQHVSMFQPFLMFMFFKHQILIKKKWRDWDHSSKKIQKCVWSI